ncbi:MAG TPA: globin [Chloroflexia bacterium]|nr:globin [Chloroflexia bacterium]
MNLYDAVGGQATFLQLTDAFYDRVAADPLLRPLFPPNMDPGKRRLALFMIESLGGPPLWSNERDFRHLLLAHHRRDFNEEERDAWVNHMLAAIEEVGINGPPRQELREWVISGADLALNHRPRRPVILTTPE